MEIFKHTNGIARQVILNCYNAIIASTIAQKTRIDSTGVGFGVVFFPSLLGSVGGERARESQEDEREDVTLVVCGFYRTPHVSSGLPEFLYEVRYPGRPLFLIGDSSNSLTHMQPVWTQELEKLSVRYRCS